MNQRGQQELSIFDQQVIRLEAKVNQLQASLTHWQNWYFDYSALKEEVDNVVSQKDNQDQNAQRQELLRIKTDFESELLTDKEISELFGENEHLKPADTITALIGRRIDYVERNIESLQKLISTEEAKLAKANIVAHPDAAVDEETGLPITDIVEQLDDDDNVVRYQLRSGQDAEPHVVEALRKLGIKDIPETEADLEKEKEEPKAKLEEKKEETKTASPAADVDSAAEKSPGRKKSVSFAEDTKPGHKVPAPTTSPAAQRREEIVTMVKEREAKETKPATPEDESSEDAELRRQMEEYSSTLPDSWSEMRHVVAELEIDSNNEEDDDEDEGWDEYDEDESYSDDEDELGRAQHSVITNEYIQRMQTLEKKLGFKSHFGAMRPDQESQTPEGEPGLITVMPEEASAVEQTEPKADSPAPKQKKSVKFASELDIADEKKPAPAKKKAKKDQPISDIVEKTEPDSISDEEEEEDETPKRVSRFKKERKAAAKTATPSIPKGPHQLPASFINTVEAARPPKQPQSLAESLVPEGKLVADMVIERNPTAPTPQEVDDLDDPLLYQAAATEYHRLRNQMIQKQGGFMKQPEKEIIPLDEEEGGPRRVSKFKAARLGK
ncbi:Prefoldin subunit domain containing protein [Rhypophila sp. PSN 637]